MGSGARSILLVAAAAALPSLALAAALSAPVLEGGTALDGGGDAGRADGAADGGAPGQDGGLAEGGQGAEVAVAAPSLPAAGGDPDAVAGETSGAETAVVDQATSPPPSRWLGQITSRGELAVEARAFRDDEQAITR